MSNLSRYEKETIINYNDEEKTADIWTYNASMIRRLEAIAKERPDDCKLIRKTDQAVEYTVPKRWIKIRPNRVMTEAQSAALEKARIASSKAGFGHSEKQQPEN